jgi:glycosyltransferase involved in cell wall biosynthesis
MRVVQLNTSPWAPRRAAWRPGEAADPRLLHRALAARGIAVEALDPHGLPWNPLAGRSPLLDGLDPLRALAVLARERRADLLLCWCEGPAFLPLLLRRACRYRPPVVLAEPILSDTWWLRRVVLALTLRRADGIIVLSSFQREAIAARWGRQEGVEVVPQPIDTAFWRPAPPAPEGPVLAIGNDHSRDFALLLDAFAGLEADLLLKTSLIPPAQPLSARASVLRASLGEAALRDLYARSRFVVVPLRPSLNAGGVNSILEAAASGRAAVVSDNPAIRDYIRHEETCLVVPCGDRAAMRAAIARLLAEPETCARLGANARRLAERLAAEAPERFAAALRRFAAAGR